MTEAAWFWTQKAGTTPQERNLGLSAFAGSARYHVRLFDIISRAESRGEDAGPEGLTWNFTALRKLHLS